MTESNTAAINRISLQLAERWPALFNAKKPVPLAIGIRETLLEAMPDATAQLLRHALIQWCNRPRYLAALAAGADRHGLEGVQGTVTEEQAAAAAERFQTLQTLLQEKQEAKRKDVEAMQVVAKRKAEQAKAQEAAEVQTTQPEAPPVLPKTAPATSKPVGPIIMVKKRRLPQPIK